MDLILKKYIFSILFLAFSSILNAQNIAITNFYLEETELTANNNKTMVIDQDGNKSALIRIQTTMKGFIFDVGMAGIQKVDESHVGEIWVYVPYGVRHITIRHPQLGSMPRYNFPITIQKAKTYYMELSTKKVFVNRYDDSKKQTLHIKIVPAKSKFILNGMDVPLNDKGETETDLSFGTYTYKVESFGFFSKEGQITINDSIKKQELLVNDLVPIKGKLSVHTNISSADVILDGKSIGNLTSLTPYELQIGIHTVEVRAKGYKTEKQIVNIQKDETSDIKFTLTQVALYKINSSPSYATVYINKERIGTTPCEKELTTGSYNVRAVKSGYKDFNKTLALNSSNPNVSINLLKIYNNRNEFYIEGNMRAGTFMAVGGTIGCYINNVNVEASYLLGTGKSEVIYWNNNDLEPFSATYSPNMNISAKAGYGIPVGTRFRLTPQIGVNFMKLKETVYNETLKPADGANVISGLVSLRFSAALVSKIAVSLSPEYSFPVVKSDGYTALSDISTDIKKWGEGFNIKIGLTLFL